MEALAKLKQSILFHEQEITEALSKDLGKSYEEGYMCEVGLVLSELNYMLKHTKKLSKRKNIKTPLEQFPSRSYQIPSPYGVVLIMSPWNYPFMLTIDPLIDALAAGNVVSIKPSAYSPNTSNIIKIILEECFDESYVSVILGGRSENHFLLEQHFNYIFFTGSKSVGREVMKYAAHFLTPVTLELGGKSPCIVDETANIPLAAKRIVFGKFLNCGQTCVAPDYIYCHVSQKEKFLAAVQTEMKSQYTSTPLRDPNYGKIVTLKHFERIVSLICPEKVVIGGNINAETLQIEPTVLSDVTWDDAVMQDEIFGPIMPILFYESLDALIDILQSKPELLALYYFSTNYANCRKILIFCFFG